MYVKDAVAARFTAICRERGIKPNELAGISGVTRQLFTVCWMHGGAMCRS